jgi:hypothetical protein
VLLFVLLFVFLFVFLFVLLNERVITSLARHWNTA